MKRTKTTRRSFLKCIGLCAAATVLPKTIFAAKPSSKPNIILCMTDDQGQAALSDNRYKIYSGNRGKTYELYDFLEDPSEKKDLAKQKPEVLEKMKKTLTKWQESCKQSAEGKGYH